MKLLVPVDKALPWRSGVQNTARPVLVDDKSGITTDYMACIYIYIHAILSILRISYNKKTRIRILVIIIHLKQ